MTINASARPKPPPAVTTSVSGTDFVVSWQASPEDHGSAVTEYVVTFKESDNTNFSEIEAHCNPIFNSAAFNSKQCQIPMTVIRAVPYSTPIDTLIVVRVQAINAKGISDPSELNTDGVKAQDVP